MTGGKTHLTGDELPPLPAQVQFVEGKLPDEDLITPEHLLHMSDDELAGHAARLGRQLIAFDEVQLLGVGWVLLGGLAVVLAIIFARQGVKMIRGEDRPFGRNYG